MVQIAPVKLSFSLVTRWFDANNLELKLNDPVVVQTARGAEYGIVAGPVFEGTEEQIEKLSSSLKPVKRKATSADTAHALVIEQKNREALPVFKRMAGEMIEEMKPIAVEFLFEDDKAIFYFEAEDRVDFRELVQKLASYFHVRVDMKQVGVRDEARLVGGIGHCGQELCCRRLSDKFNPVSIRMAKEQDLSLNPQKISGLCGRLMCCLRYETDIYKEFKSRAPKLNAKIVTPEGIAKVTDLNMPRETVSVALEDQKPVKIPLSEMDPPREGHKRPNSVSDEAWKRAHLANRFDLFDATALSSELAGDDALMNDDERDLENQSRKRQTRGRKRRVRHKNQTNEAADQQKESSQKSARTSTRNARPRRSVKVDTTDQLAFSLERVMSESQTTQKKSKKRSKKRKKQTSGRRMHHKKTSGSAKTRTAGDSRVESGVQQKQTSTSPGRKSSGLRTRRLTNDTARANTPVNENKKNKGGSTRRKTTNTTGRRSRRSHKIDGGTSIE